MSRGRIRVRVRLRFSIESTMKIRSSIRVRVRLRFIIESTVKIRSPIRVRIRAIKAEVTLPEAAGESGMMYSGACRLLVLGHARVWAYFGVDQVATILVASHSRSRSSSRSHSCGHSYSYSAAAHKFVHVPQL